MRWIRRLLGLHQPIYADVIASTLAGDLGGPAMGVVAGLVPSNFGLRDLGGGAPLNDAHLVREALVKSLRDVPAVTPYLVIDLLRALDLVQNEAGGMAVIDATLAAAVVREADSVSGQAARVVIDGFDLATIRQDRIRFTAGDIVANAASIADKWSD